MKKEYFAPLIRVQELKEEPVMQSTGFGKDTDLNVDEF